MSTFADRMSQLPTDPHKVDAVPAQIFLGLGGVGGKIIDRIGVRLEASPEWQRYRRNCVGFMAIDTDYEELKQLEARIPYWVHIAQAERAGILQYLRAQPDPWLESWLDPDYTPRKSAHGAGQIRLESRVSFYVFSEKIERKFEALLDDLLEQDNPYLGRSTREIDVFVFGSLAGGTGSGCFLSAPCLLREVIERRGWRAPLLGHFLTATSLEAYFSCGDYLSYTARTRI